MSNNKRERIVRCNSEPIEAMTSEERDNYFKSFCGMTYAEFCEKYEDDTVEKITEDMHKHIKTIE